MLLMERLGGIWTHNGRCSMIPESPNVRTSGNIPRVSELVQYFLFAPEKPDFCRTRGPGPGLSVRTVSLWFVVNVWQLRECWSPGLTWSYHLGWHGEFGIGPRNWLEFKTKTRQSKTALTRDLNCILGIESYAVLEVLTHKDSRDLKTCSQDLAWKSNKKKAETNSSPSMTWAEIDLKRIKNELRLQFKDIFEDLTWTESSLCPQTDFLFKRTGHLSWTCECMCRTWIPNLDLKTLVFLWGEASAETVL